MREDKSSSAYGAEDHALTPNRTTSNREQEHALVRTPKFPEVLDHYR